MIILEFLLYIILILVSVALIEYYRDRTIKKKLERDNLIVDDDYFEEEREYESERRILGLKRPSTVLEPYISDGYNNTVSIYKSQKIIEVQGGFYKFDDIIDYDCDKLNTSGKVINTSTSSALKRAAAGGVLFGEVGAIAGASTAKKKVDEGEVKYRITISVNNIDSPMIVILTKDDYYAKRLCSTLNVILNNKAEQ